VPKVALDTYDKYFSLLDKFVFNQLEFTISSFILNPSWLLSLLLSMHL